MTDGLLIGEVAERSSITRKALRLYESRGIVPIIPLKKTTFVKRGLEPVALHADL